MHQIIAHLGFSKAEITGLAFQFPTRLEILFGPGHTRNDFVVWVVPSTTKYVPYAHASESLLLTPS